VVPELIQTHGAFNFILEKWLDKYLEIFEIPMTRWHWRTFGCAVC